MKWFTQFFDTSSLMPEVPITTNNQVIDMGAVLNDEMMKLAIQAKEEVLLKRMATKNKSAA